MSRAKKNFSLVPRITKTTVIAGVAVAGVTSIAVWWWLFGKALGRAAHVMASYAQSKGIRYSYGGGHPASSAKWPYGSAGVRGGVGWDCSGWVQAVMNRARSARFKVPDGNAAALWEAAGRPINSGITAKPGDLIFWGSPTKVVHVGFVTAPGQAVSAMGHSDTNADDPNRVVKLHSWTQTGLPLLGTTSW